MLVTRLIEMRIWILHGDLVHVNIIYLRLNGLYDILVRLCMRNVHVGRECHLRAPNETWTRAYAGSHGVHD
jgi:hypothetical protein